MCTGRRTDGRTAGAPRRPRSPRRLAGRRPAGRAGGILLRSSTVVLICGRTALNPRGGRRTRPITRRRLRGTQDAGRPQTQRRVVVRRLPAPVFGQCWTEVDTVHFTSRTTSLSLSLSLSVSVPRRRSQISSSPMLSACTCNWSKQDADMKKRLRRINWHFCAWIDSAFC